MSKTSINMQCLKFLQELAQNNNREWFAANKARYEQLVREPCLQLIADLQAPLRKISEHYRADPRGQGGSMMRVYRDTRFSNDKTPYKVNVGIRFFHERAREIEAPSFYLNIQPGRCFVGAGQWHPQPVTTKRIREFLLANPAAWKKATRSKKFLSQFELGGDSLTRPPRGFDADHELINDIKRKDFTAWRSLTDAQVTSEKLIATVIESLKGLAPLVDYLCAAAELEF